MDGPQRTRFISAFVVLLVFLGINGIISQRSTRKLIQNEQLVAHTHEVLANLDQTLAMLTEAESGQRGFILTGNEVYLANYKEDLHRLPEQIEKLKRLTADNPSQQQRVVRLEEEINQRIATLNDVLELARTQGVKAASHTIESNAGRVLMSEARATMNEMQAEEQRLLDIRARESRQSAFRTLLTFAAVNVITIGLVAALYLLFRRYLSLQHAANEELKKQQAALRVSYQRMELAQQASNFSVFQWDIPDNALSWFGDTQTIYGRRASQLKSYRGWLEALHPDDRAQVHEALQNLLRSGAPFAQEFRVIWPNGEEHWIAGMGRLFYEDG